MVVQGKGKGVQMENGVKGGKGRFCNGINDREGRARVKVAVRRITIGRR